VVTILAFVLVLGILILVHEFGHFWVARRVGVAVEEFALGFPPRLLSWVRRGTRYSLNLIPFGGFVRMAGEESGNPEGPQADANLKPEGMNLNDASRLRRAAIMSAGVLMNFVLGALLLSVGFAIGLPQVVDRLDQPGVRDAHVQIVSLTKGSPADRAGLVPGDVVVSLDGQPVADLEQIQAYTASHAGKAIGVAVLRDGKPLAVSLTPEKLADAPGRASVGVGLVLVGRVAVAWWQAPWYGLRAAWHMAMAIFAGLGDIIAKLFTGHTGQVEVAGPIGVAVLTGQAVRLGWLYLLQFVAVLSINLAVINVLPLPALDGGRLAVLAIEGIRRKPLPEAFENSLHRYGFSALIGLLILVTVIDARRFGAGIWHAVVGLFS
jgi:regulator of sigma E protease